MESKNLNETLGSFLNGLPRELQDKAKACRDTGSLANLLSEAGVELPDETEGEITENDYAIVNQLLFVYNLCLFGGTVGAIGDAGVAVGVVYPLGFQRY